MLMSEPTLSPKSIERLENSICIVWQDGHRSVYETNYLRRKCPCVMCKGSQEQSPDGGIELPSYSDLRLTYSQLVGRYAVNLAFSDSHDTGIYSFEHLRKICPCPDCRKSN